MDPLDQVPTVADSRALRALAHPCRLDLLEALGVHGPLTATTAAELLDQTPANCSWHLRQLAKYGFIEEVPESTGRQRPWRRTSRGLAWSDAETDPASAAAARALTDVFVDREFRLIKQAMGAPVPEGWSDTVVAIQSLNWLTAEEIRELEGEVFALLSQYRHRVDHPAQRPDGSRPVRMLALAIPDDRITDLTGDSNA